MECGNEAKMGFCFTLENIKKTLFVFVFQTPSSVGLPAPSELDYKQRAPEDFLR